MNKINVTLSMTLSYDVDDEIDVDGYGVEEYKERAFEDLFEILRDEDYASFDVQIEKEEDDFS